eukprot:128299_1
MCAGIKHHTYQSDFCVDCAHCTSSEGSPNKSSQHIVKLNSWGPQSKSISPHSYTSILHVAKAEQHTKVQFFPKSNASKFYQNISPLEPSDDVRIPSSDSIISSLREFSQEIGRHTPSPPHVLHLRMSISSDVHYLGKVFLSQRGNEPTSPIRFEATSIRLEQTSDNRLEPPSHNRLEPLPHSRLEPPSHSRLEPPSHNRLEPPSHEFISQNSPNQFHSNINTRLEAISHDI